MSEFEILKGDIKKQTNNYISTKMHRGKKGIIMRKRRQNAKWKCVIHTPFMHLKGKVGLHIYTPFRKALYNSF